MTFWPTHLTIGVCNLSALFFFNFNFYLFIDSFYLFISHFVVSFERNLTQNFGTTPCNYTINGIPIPKCILMSGTSSLYPFYPFYRNAKTFLFLILKPWIEISSTDFFCFTLINANNQVWL